MTTSYIKEIVFERVSILTTNLLITVCKIIHIQFLKMTYHLKLVTTLPPECVISAVIPKVMQVSFLSNQQIYRFTEDMSTLGSALVKHSLLVCVLWLLTCCTGAASEDYRRTMWVSTTGEDSPQCIHDTPTSDPVPHPRHLNESCRSLNYALTHIQNVTFIVIACGTYELKPVNKLLDGVQLLNITGSCFYEDLHDPPKIQCTDGANLELHNLQRVVFTHLAFQGCGKQMQQRDSSFSASTLYFQDSLTVTMYHVDIDITSSYGTGISLICRDSTTTNREVVLDTVKVDHHGINGNGIHFELHTGEKTNVNRLGMKIRLNEVRVNGEFSPQILNLAQTFSGINISVMGHGEGDEIALTKVNVRDSGLVSSTGRSINAFCYWWRRQFQLQ